MGYRLYFCGGVGFGCLTATTIAGSPFSPKLLILHDLGLLRLAAQQFTDPHELSIPRHRGCKFVITSKRAVGEWLSFFYHPILGTSALNRLANASYQIVIEGANYREKLPPRKLPGAKKNIDPS